MIAAKSKLATGRQIIRSKNGHVAVRVNTLMTEAQETQFRAGMNDIEAMVEVEIEKLSSRVLKIEMRGR
jgi:hypothetical protein